MHFFVLIAGLVAGWRVGLCVGVITPLISFELSGMPLLNLLPIILIEVAVYGLAAGILREKLKLNLWLALIGAMIIGRIFLGLAAAVFSVKIGAINYLINVVTVGWIGIAIQLALVPLIVNRLYHYLKK